MSEIYKELHNARKTFQYLVATNIVGRSAEELEELEIETIKASKNLMRLESEWRSTQ